MKQFLIFLGIFISICSIGLAVYFGISSKNNYEKGYNDGTEDLSAYEQLIENYKNTISDMTIELEENRTELSETIIKLNNALSQNNQNKETIKTLTNQVETLTNQINEMQEKIKYYEELLEAYLENDENTFKAEFYINDELQDIKIVNASVKVVFPNITVEQPYLFKGWSLDGETIIEDTSNYYIGEDTKFYAVIKFDSSRNNVVSYVNSNNYYAISYCESPAMIDSVLTGEIGSNYYTLLNEVNIFKDDIVNNYKLILATPDGIEELDCKSISHSTERIEIENNNHDIDIYKLSFEKDNKTFEIIYKLLPDFNSVGGKYNICQFLGYGIPSYSDGSLVEPITLAFVKTSAI